MRVWLTSLTKMNPKMKMFYTSEERRNESFEDARHDFYLSIRQFEAWRGYNKGFGKRV